MGEHDDLAALAGFGQTRGDPIAVQVVERGHRVVEDDRGLRVDGRQLGEEGGERGRSDARLRSEPCRRVRSGC